MKKFLLFLLINCSLLFAKDWETIKFHDEFGDLTGAVSIYEKSQDNKSAIQFFKDDGYYCFRLFLDEYSKDKNAPFLKKILLKIDMNEPSKNLGFAVLNKTALLFDADDDFIEELKKGKVLKIALKTPKNKNTVCKFDLNNFSKAIKKINE